MKKLLAIVLALVFCLSLVACGGDKETAGTSDLSDLVDGFTSDVNSAIETTPNFNNSTDASSNQASGSEESSNTLAPSNDDAEKVADYVEIFKAEYVAGIEASLTDGGIHGTADLVADGTDLVSNIYVEEYGSLTAEQKAAAQAAAPTMQASFNALLAEIQSECPEVTSFTANYCDADGNLVFTLSSK